MKEATANKNLVWLTRQIFQDIKKDRLDWEKYYQNLETTVDDTLEPIAKRITGTTEFIKKYFFERSMKVKRHQATLETYERLREKGYSERVSKYVSKCSPMPVEDEYGRDLFSVTLGLVVGRPPKPLIELVSIQSNIPIEKIEKGAYWMEYLNNITSIPQIAATTLVVTNGVYALFAKEALPIETNTLLVAGVGIGKYLHTIVDHIRYTISGKYSANHAMIATQLSWPIYLVGTALKIGETQRNRIKES